MLAVESLRFMNPAIRRLASLVAVFAVAFTVVTLLRNWRGGGDWRSWFQASQPAGQFRAEPFSLPEKPPLDLGDVELLTRLNDEYARLTGAVVPSVVSISTTGIRSQQLLDGWGQRRTRDLTTRGQGSGVIVTPEGHVLTNHHVIDGQQKIQVTLHDGKNYDARLVGEDPLLDIAVLKIESTGKFTPLAFGDSSKVQVGQMVFAVGNPFGLGETVTQGIISAKERSLSDNQRDLFQTDAAINPGNSGGPLVNLRGEIIGINVAIYSKDKENPGFQGVGFSIPSNDAKESLLQILARGRPVYGYIGVQVEDLHPRLRAALEYPDNDGVAVMGVASGSPAAAAGLQAFDVIRSVNGEVLRTSTQAIALFHRSKLGSVLELDVWRKGESLTLKAIVAESGSAPQELLPPADPAASDLPADSAHLLKSLGLEIRDLTVPERLRGFRGVLVTGVAENGPAGRQLQAGDLIVAVNQTQTTDLREFLGNLSASIAKRDTALIFSRQGRAYRVLLPALPHQE